MADWEGGGPVKWIGDGRPGVRYRVLRQHPEGGATLVTAFAAGTRSGWHTHPGGEELFVLQGRCAVGGKELAQGDYLHTSPGEAHELVAHEHTFVLVVLPQLPIYGVAGHA